MTAGTSILSGFVCGYFVISVCESFFHRSIGHASPRLRRLYKWGGWLGSALTEAWFSHHVVHHCLTFRVNHVTQFSSDEERFRLDAQLKANGADDNIDCKYGLIVGKQPKNFV